ncbi:MAG: malonate transporter subunit MadL [Lysobacterales bacterium]
MTIYGVSLLAACLLTGAFLGQLIGQLMGIQANVGGVGIAMLLLLFLTNLSQERFKLKPITAGGISFWSAMYIPIVVAMAAKQNVIAALSGGWMALLAGVLAVVASFLLIPVLSRLVRSY